MTVSELATLVGGQLSVEADPQVRISGMVSLPEAREGDLAFYANPAYLAALRKCKASAVLVPLDFAETIGPVCIRCENPAKAFGYLVEKSAPPPIVFQPGVHPSAFIGKDVILGEGVSVQPYAVIQDGAEVGARTVVGAHGYIGHFAKVGSDCTLHPRVIIEERCIVGNRVILHGGVVIGSDGFGYEMQGGRHVKIPQIGIVQVDDDVEIGANTCVDRARFGRTWIQSGSKIDNLVQIAHNVVIGKHAVLCGQVGISGSTRVGNYAMLAGQVGVAGHLEIGDQAVLGAQAGVTKSLPGKEMYMGYPALPAKEFRELNAHVRSIERLKRRVAALEQVLSETMKSLPPKT